MAKKICERRGKVMYITADLIVEIAKNAVENSLPKDAKVISVKDDFQRGAFALVIVSKEYDPVEEGEVIPELKECPVLTSNDVFVKAKSE